MTEKKLPHDHGQENRKEPYLHAGHRGFPDHRRCLQAVRRREPGTHLLAVMPLRRMCHQHLLYGGHVKPRRLPPPQAVKDQRPCYQPPGGKRSLL